MTSVGEILRRERQAQGREMAEIAEDLCITQRYLRALEEDDLKSLPGTFFYKSFVKQYAAVLGLDEAKLLPGVEVLSAGAEPLPPPGADPKYAPVREIDPLVADSNRLYFSNTRIGYSVAALAVVLLGCSGFYTWWTKASHETVASGVKQAGRVPVVPVASSNKPATSVPTFDVTTETGPDGVKHVVLNVSATETTWLSITSEGKNIFSGILEPSQTKTLRASDMAKMKVGNAGGLDVRLNGKSIGPIGPRGQVREILFTPENFHILEPAPKSTL